jgi:uncharacterized protein YkwD
VRGEFAQALSALRSGACRSGDVPLPELGHVASLDLAARDLDGGRSIHDALRRSGYLAASASALHVTASASDLSEALRRAGCKALGDPLLTQFGLYQHGLDHWIVLAEPYAAPAQSAAVAVAQRALVLVNEARAHGAQCGDRYFPAAAALALDPALTSAARGHARDMARHGYFDHRDRAGHTPAERVRAAGYRDSLVGENIAYGPAGADEVVHGWLDSPGHCENILNAGFTAMGIAYEAGRTRDRPGLYWVQALARPRSAVNGDRRLP